jgi:hypothetical protein
MQDSGTRCVSQAENGFQLALERLPHLTPKERQDVNQEEYQRERRVGEEEQRKGNRTRERACGCTAAA